MAKDLNNISKLVDDLMESNWAASIAIKITKNGQEIFKKITGKQDIEKNIEISDNTLFKAYSMTKPLTAISFMHLLNIYNNETNLKSKIKSKIDKKTILDKITPETELRHLFKKWSKSNLKHSKGEQISREITIGDVLSMTGGIPYINKDVMKNLIMWRIFGRQNMKSFANTISKISLISQPGELWNYSLSMDLLGAIGERILKLSKLSSISDKDWGSFVQNQIIKKLDMNDSWYGRAMKQKDIDRIQITSITKEDGELIDGSEFKDVKNINRSGWFKPLTKNQTVPMGGNTLITSLEDYVKFQNFMITGLDNQNNQLIPVETLKEVATNKLNDHQIKEGENILRPGFGYGYGMRVKVNDCKETPSIPNGTFGWDGMMCTLSLMHIETGICVCLMTSKMRPFSIKGKKSIYSIDEIYEIMFKALLKNGYLK